MKSRPVHAWYALRRTLPIFSFENNLAELVRYLPKYRVDEVIIKVDVEEFSHGQPTIAWLEAYLPKLWKIKAAMDKIGVVYSLNPWITLGHGDRGRDAAQNVPGIQTLVGHDGGQSTACACPISPAWREHVANLWRLYAQTHPRVIWVEDDIRSVNHGPARFGCFCPLHMERFSRVVGQTVKREQLVSALLQPGEPHPWRTKWLDLQRDIMIDTVGHLAQAVHAVDGNVQFGLMSSGHHYHCIEGRNWDGFCRAMMRNGSQTFYHRPPLGNYMENSLRGFYYTQDSIKGSRHVCPPGTIDQTEVENFPFGRYANSDSFTFLKLAMTFTCGARGTTMNLYDHMGTPMQNSPTIGTMLAKSKPFLDAMAQATQGARYRGLQLLHHEKTAYVKHLRPHADYDSLYPRQAPVMEHLESHGIATTYQEESTVVAGGQLLRAFSDEQIERMLRGGLMLDGMAANVLFERGFGEHIGLKSCQPVVPTDDLGSLGAEAYFNEAFGGDERSFLTLITASGHRNVWMAVMKPLPGAQIVSQIVDPDVKRGHVSSYAYENRLGGRVFVQALEFATSATQRYCRATRARLLQAATRWTSRNQAPLLVSVGDQAWPLALRADHADRTILVFFNLCLDDWPAKPGVVLDLDGKRTLDSKRGARVLGTNGIWRHDKALTVRRSRGRVTVHWSKPVSFRQPLVIEVPWRS